MRLLRTAAAAALIVLAGACGDSPTGVPEDGRFTGVLNGRAWNGSASISGYQETLYLTSVQGGENGERFTLTLAPLAGGGFRVVEEESRFHDITGGDVAYTAAITDVTLDAVLGSETMVGTASFTVTGAQGEWRFVAGEFVARNEIGKIDGRS